jgi:hypothetical protein
MEWNLLFEQPDEFLHNISFKMEALGCRCEKKELKKKMILDTEVSKAEIMKNIDFKSSM